MENQLTIPINFISSKDAEGGNEDAKIKNL